MLRGFLLLMSRAEVLSVAARARPRCPIGSFGSAAKPNPVRTPGGVSGVWPTSATVERTEFVKSVSDGVGYQKHRPNVTVQGDEPPHSPARPDGRMSSFLEFLSAAADFALTLNLKAAIVAGCDQASLNTP